jgi:FkbM family methyltransferase
MIRSTVRAVARTTLPDAAKRWLNPWRFGARGLRSTAAPEVVFEQDGAVRILPDIRLRLDDRLRAELADHFVHHDESRDEMAAFLAEARRRSGVLLDIGSHQGLFGLVFCAARPDNSAFLYDPSGPAIEIARNAIVANGLASRATTHVAVVGSRAGRLRMALQPSGFAVHAHDATSRGTFDVDAVTIDGECHRLGIMPTVIKIDTEGDELDVLQGAAAVIESVRPILFIELHLDILDARGSSARALCDFVGDHGYRLYATSGRRLLPITVHQSLRAVRRIVAKPRQGETAF